MRELKTNTAVIITVGPFFDKTDGVTIETALTISNERITLTADTDAGSAPTLILDNITGATSGTANDLNYITNNDAGLMQLELAAADVNRLGRMFLTITDAANHVPVFHEFEVVSAAYYDWKYGTTIPPVNATQFAGQTITAAAGVTLPSSIASPTNITSASGVALAAGQKVDVDTIKTNPVVNAGTVTFPANATLASTTNLTAGTVATVTNDVGITQTGADKVWSTATRVLTAGTNIALAKGTGLTGLNDIPAGAAMTLTATYDAAKTALQSGGDVNVKTMNGATLQGDGTAGNLWRG